MNLNKIISSLIFPFPLCMAYLATLKTERHAQSLFVDRQVDRFKTELLRSGHSHVCSNKAHGDIGDRHL